MRLDPETATADLITDLLGLVRSGGSPLFRASVRHWTIADADLCALVGSLAADPSFRSSLSLSHPNLPGPYSRAGAPTDRAAYCA